MLQVVEIITYEKQGSAYPAWSIPWLLMAWRYNEAGHQKPRFWPSPPRIWLVVYPSHYRVQDCSNSSALARELLQSCTKPSICMVPVDSGNTVCSRVCLSHLYHNFPCMYECWIWKLYMWKQSSILHCVHLYNFPILQHRLTCNLILWFQHHQDGNS